MKTIVKILWFSLAFILGNYLLKFITTNNLDFLMDKLKTPSPLHDYTSDFFTKHLGSTKQILIFTIMFLGLDIIGGDIKGVFKGPFKFILNAVLYLIGFTVIFTVFNFVIL